MISGSGSKSEIYNAFDQGLADKLAPYSGLKGYNARYAINEQELLVSDAEAVAINEFSHKEAAERLLSKFNDLYEFSSECQTVIASVAFQYGDIENRCPMFLAPDK